MNACRWSLGFCGLVSLFLVGCTTPAAVHYTPVAAVEPLVPEGAKPLRVFVARLSDKRATPDIIGANKNLYGMKVNDVRTSDDISLIMAEALTDVLRKGGVHAELHPERKQGDKIPDAELSKYDMLISGEIVQFNVDTKPGWNSVDATAQVTIRVCITRNGKEEWVGPIDGAAKQGELMGGLSSCMSQALDSAMQNCMRAVVQHLSASGALTAR